MNIQYYRDRHGNRIGHSIPIGIIEVGYLKNGQRVGYYDPRVDVTYTPCGSRVGFGNLLVGLIMRQSCS
ncbi:hypothetical protein HH800_25845 (plasmid) [Sphingobium yanoikuyae]|jgi:hypothetical protein|uniref:Uncharacterized protein n=1 Tax=Sphingobium yanoikuyae TaxID=13690 RepID=A0A6M4GEZ8_SPHYA|nr:hypothetical protein [Sphingobium yanoikuyae]QJR05690.1 hypothetical protein HH800_25845 [Sphingobium yanoikuyae]